MSSKFHLSSSGIAVIAVGIVLIIIGALMTFYAVSATGGIVNPKLVTPFGVLILVLGILLVLSKED